MRRNAGLENAENSWIKRVDAWTPRSLTYGATLVTVMVSAGNSELSPDVVVIE